MKGGGEFIGNRIRTNDHNRSNHMREKCESDHVDSDSEPQLFSDIWSLTLSDGDADHNLEAGSDSVEGRSKLNISYLASQMSCMACESVLALVNIKRELRFGFASQFKILCEICSPKGAKVYPASRRRSNNKRVGLKGQLAPHCVP